MSLCKDKGRELKGRVDYIVGLDARGFLIGPVMAIEAGVPFIPVIRLVFNLKIIVLDLA